MTTSAPVRLRRLPRYLGAGLVSPVAYRVAALAFGDGVRLPRRLPLLPRVEVDASGDTDLFRYIADLLEVDEADVLRAMAELQRVGAIVKREGK
jgi:hypothetical protein